MQININQRINQGRTNKKPLKWKSVIVLTTSIKAERQIIKSDEKRKHVKDILQG